MRRFALLWECLETLPVEAQVATLQRYLSGVPSSDAAWAVYFLAGRKVSGVISSMELRAFVLEISQLPEWLFEECREQVGDLTETITLCIPVHVASLAPEPEISLAEWIEQRLRPLSELSGAEKCRRVGQWWGELRGRELTLLNRLLTGSLRTVISPKPLVQALSGISGVSEPTLTQRLSENWAPTPEFYERLTARPPGARQDPGASYPFFLASSFGPPPSPDFPENLPPSPKNPLKNPNNLGGWRIGEWRRCGMG